MNVANLILINPVVKSLELLGDRWTILILRDAFLGRHRFEEFRVHTGASRSTLSKRLETLIQQDVLVKKPYQLTPVRNEYRLTKKGLALYPWALLIWQWESRWCASENQLPPTLIHKFQLPGDEGAAAEHAHELDPQVVCRHCRVALDIDDVERQVLEDNGEGGVQALRTIGSQRRSRGARGSEQVSSLGHITDIIGDRWAALVIAAAFMGLQRYDDFRRQLGIATNILADRLKRLSEAGVFERTEYQSNPPRSEYSLTEKGKALYPFTMTMRQWSLDWLDPMENIPFRLIHKPCGHDLVIDVACSNCGEVPKPQDVTYKHIDLPES